VPSPLYHEIVQLHFIISYVDNLVDKQCTLHCVYGDLESIRYVRPACRSACRMLVYAESSVFNDIIVLSARI